MVQVLSVSAITAAYAAQAVKPAARVSGVSTSDRTAQAAAAEARKSLDQDRVTPLNVSQPPSVARFFLTAQRQPDRTFNRAAEHYLEQLLDDGVDDAETEAHDDPGS